jgi:hypothetical protein
MTHYFCEADDDSPGQRERILLGIQGECPTPATRRIAVVQFDYERGLEETDEHYLCSQHTLAWLAIPANRRQMHIVASLQYNVEVASWIGPNGEDGLEPPIGQCVPKGNDQHV